MTAPASRPASRTPLHTALALAATATAAWLPGSAAAQACEARASAQPPAVIELYTSEGCSSCPPADRWLSALKGRSDVVALAFHVNYWDRLGWPDRFATPALTERQHLLAQSSGSTTVYTPQVVMNGRDLRSWSSTAPARLPTSTLPLALKREANTVTASIGPHKERLAGYWAVLEDGHASRVKAGENAGETLKHDHVVTLYKPVEAWPAGPEAKQLSLALPAAPAGISRRVAFVVTEAGSHRPLQALTLGC